MAAIANALETSSYLNIFIFILYLHFIYVIIILYIHLIYIIMEAIISIP